MHLAILIMYVRDSCRGSGWRNVERPRRHRWKRSRSHRCSLLVLRLLSSCSLPSENGRPARGGASTNVVGLRSAKPVNAFATCCSACTSAGADQSATHCQTAGGAPDQRPVRSPNSAFASATAPCPCLIYPTRPVAQHDLQLKLLRSVDPHASQLRLSVFQCQRNRGRCISRTRRHAQKASLPIVNGPTCTSQ